MKLALESVSSNSNGMVNDASSRKTVYCDNCYRMVEEGTTVCPDCGKSVIGSKGAHLTDTVESTKKKFLYKRWLFIVLVAMGLLSACGSSDENVTVAEATAPAEAIITEAAENVDEPATEVSETLVPEPVYLSPNTQSDNNTAVYVLNTDSMKFHYSDCSSAAKISAKNRSSFAGTRADMIAKGYSPCGNCNP